jgi:hypothetical protein
MIGNMVKAWHGIGRNRVRRANPPEAGCERAVNAHLAGFLEFSRRFLTGGVAML